MSTISAAGSPPEPAGTGGIGLDAKWTTPEPHPLSPWQRWCRFWFPKADPTTLAFIRISTGLLVLYIHLAYSVDLQAFFGEHGWYAARFIERERRESPMMAYPLADRWEDPPQGWAQLSDFPHRRAALMRYLRSLPQQPQQRERELAYLQRVAAFDSPADVLVALNYIQQIGTEKDLERYLAALLGQAVERGGETGGGEKSPSFSRPYEPPPLFATLRPDEKRQLAEEVRDFWKALQRVAWEDPKQERGYVLNHFAEVSPVGRRELVEFMRTLPTDPQQREELLEYLEYWNIDPRKAYSKGHSIFSMWFHVTDPWAMAAIHAGVLVVMAMFTIGLFTRVTAVLVWLATVSYIHRTQQVLFGMDTMMNILLFYLMIGNSGAALSIDRLIARYRAVRHSLRQSGTIDAATRTFLAYPPPSVNTGFALRLIQVHFCFIYMAAGLSKLKGGMWWNGLAFWEVLVNPEFTPMHYQWYESALRWLETFKPVYYVMIALGVWFTLFIEIAGPFLFWTRLRWLVIVLASLMHAVIAVIMGLNLFELLMIVMLLAFLPDRVIRDRFRGGRELPRLQLEFDPKQDGHGRAAAMAAAVDVDNQIRYVPTPQLINGLCVVSADGKRHCGEAAARHLAATLRLAPLLQVATLLPGLSRFWRRSFAPPPDRGQTHPLDPRRPAASGAVSPLPPAQSSRQAIN